MHSCTRNDKIFLCKWFFLCGDRLKSKINALSWLLRLLEPFRHWGHNVKNLISIKFINLYPGSQVYSGNWFCFLSGNPGSNYLSSFHSVFCGISYVNRIVSAYTTDFAHSFVSQTIGNVHLLGCEYIYFCQNN